MSLSDWLAIGGGSATASARAERPLWRALSLRIGSLDVAGQQFPDVEADASVGESAWLIRLSGPNADGLVTVPFDLERRPLVLDMKRLWLLSAGEPAEAAPAAPASRSDPRKLPALEVRSADLALGEWHFGSLELLADKSPEGLVFRRVATRAPAFTVDGAGAWRVIDNDVQRQSTRMDAKLVSGNFGQTLDQLGYGPVMTGEKANIGIALSWPGGPRAGFLAAASGEISVDITDGQIRQLDPGSGRLLGLMSVTALPRRLSLDFSDVFRKGFGFDRIRGDFRVVNGNAYTCNLGLTGPAADLGIVGRTGFGGHDYDQVAVVQPRVGGALAVGGAVLGGPVGGATMLLISQLFRKPLSTLGESYYRVTGSWDRPTVAPLERARLDVTPFRNCEEEVAVALRQEQSVAPVPAAPSP